ncbi:hypothetical protein L207DRAFT_591908 [Hyaloscypha variabilis F]|uniref:F-box domain-containing protein n=1 Tax=Hyaloscypha variabilis (strain UAMH 11265 / GT02V1 / F) TaxID=1149755 RepID=A0A2J6QXH1_HYAVF|nr:hypothetical protein L207DRAFT_591908 [Hyaloscypha variabilis F]
MALLNCSGGSLQTTKIRTSSRMTSDHHDYLTSLPPEILTNIIAEVPLSSFLDLTHTCRGLRNFIKVNAARICNLAILARFTPEANPLGLTLKDNWLIVTHPQLLEDQREHEKKRAGLRGSYFISDPGPLTLFSLEQGLVEKDQVYIYSLRLQKLLGKVNKVLRLRKEHGEVQPMEV